MHDVVSSYRYAERGQTLSIRSIITITRRPENVGVTFLRVQKKL